MDITKTAKQRNNRVDSVPDFIGTSKRTSTAPQYGGNSRSGGGGIRRGAHDDLRAQFEDAKEQNRTLRSQLQVRTVAS